MNHILLYKSSVLVSERADAIVNAADVKLTDKGAVSRQIFDNAGKRLNDACAEIGGCAVGNAVITRAYSIPQADYIIHAVGPHYMDGESGEEQLLYQCYQNILRLAAEYKCRVIHCPLISAGRHGFPTEKAIATALASCAAYFQEHPDQDAPQYIALTIPETDKYELAKRLLFPYVSPVSDQREAELTEGLDPDTISDCVRFFSDEKRIPVLIKENQYPEFERMMPIGLNMLNMLTASVPDIYYHKYRQQMYDEGAAVKIAERLQSGALVCSEMNVTEICAYLESLWPDEQMLAPDALMHCLEDRTVIKLLLRLDDLHRRYFGPLNCCCRDFTTADAIFQSK